MVANILRLFKVGFVIDQVTRLPTVFWIVWSFDYESDCAHTLSAGALMWWPQRKMTSPPPPPFSIDTDWCTSKTHTPLASAFRVPQSAAIGGMWKQQAARPSGRPAPRYRRCGMMSGSLQETAIWLLLRRHFSCKFDISDFLTANAGLDYKRVTTQTREGNTGSVRDGPWSRNILSILQMQKFPVGTLVVIAVPRSISRIDQRPKSRSGTANKLASAIKFSETVWLIPSSSTPW